VVKLDIKEIKKIRDTKGFQACLDKVGERDIKGILICESLNPDYWVGEAEGFAKELSRRYVHEPYLVEKLSHQIHLMSILHRFGDEPNRHGTKETKEFWEDMDLKMKRYRGRY